MKNFTRYSTSRFSCYLHLRNIKDIKHRIPFEDPLLAIRVRWHEKDPHALIYLGHEVYPRFGKEAYNLLKSYGTELILALEVNASPEELENLSQSLHERQTLADQRLDHYRIHL